jgi:serine/threonine protein phosphatase PrpC
MVCDAIAELTPDPTFEGTIDVVRERLQGVNDYLLRTGSQSTMVDRSASTVVVLLARGPSCAILWVGDSRLYRWRAGKLEQLTQDHSVQNSGGILDGQTSSNAITRAVGVQDVLSLDVLRGKVLSGDRFLLCSDGLSRTLSDAQIESLMAEGDLGAAVHGLIAATLAAGAPDNVTALIAEAYPDVI